MILLLALLTLANAQAASVCGTIDVAQTDNASLASILFFADADANRRVKRDQCGIPGEHTPFCSACSATTSESMMKVLRPVLGTPEHSAWHSEWHRIRSAPPTPEEFSQLQSRGYIAQSETLATFAAHINQGALAGEDFFFMHRTMIKMVQMELAAAGEACIAPWQNLPESIHDATWPVPKKWEFKAHEEQAELELKKLRARLAKLRDPARLAKVSLNKFGLAIEAGLHQELHHFYRSNPVCSAEARAQGIKCDDLLPPATSALNKYFWKIHGLVDEMLGDWLKANRYTEISRDCGARAGCYQWQGTWIGKYPRADQ